MLPWCWHHSKSKLLVILRWSFLPQLTTASLKKPMNSMCSTNSQLTSMLEFCFLLCDLYISRITIIWKPTKNMKSQAPLRRTESKSTVYSVIWTYIRFENHCVRTLISQLCYSCLKISIFSFVTMNPLIPWERGPCKIPAALSFMLCN